MAKNENRNFSYMTRRIGGTTYKVKVVWSDTGYETLEDKILRLVRNEAVTIGGTCDIILKESIRFRAIKKEQFIQKINCSECDSFQLYQGAELWR